MRLWRGPGCSGWPLLPERDCASAISEQASVLSILTVGRDLVVSRARDGSPAPVRSTSTPSWRASGRCPVLLPVVSATVRDWPVTDLNSVKRFRGFAALETIYPANETSFLIRRRPPETSVRHNLASNDSGGCHEHDCKRSRQRTSGTASHRRPFLEDCDILRRWLDRHPLHGEIRPRFWILLAANTATARNSDRAVAGTDPPEGFALRQPNDPALRAKQRRGRWQAARWSPNKPLR